MGWQPHANGMVAVADCFPIDALLRYPRTSMSDRSTGPLVEAVWVPDAIDLGLVISGCGNQHRKLP